MDRALCWADHPSAEKDRQTSRPHWPRGRGRMRLRLYRRRVIGFSKCVDNFFAKRLHELVEGGDPASVEGA